MIEEPRLGKIPENKTIDSQEEYYRKYVGDKFKEVLNFERRATNSKNTVQIFTRFHEHGFEVPMSGFRSIDEAVSDFINIVHKNGTTSPVYQSAVSRLYASLQEYKYVTGTNNLETPPEIWQHKIQEVATDSKLRHNLESLSDFLIVEAINLHKDEMRREFKIHLNPQKQYSPAIQKKFFELLASHLEMQELVTAVKITVREEGDLDEGGLPDDVADIIVYVYPGNDVESTIQNCKTLLEIIQNNFRDDEMNGKELDEAPRNNFSINKLLHVAQSGGDFKKWLARKIDPRATVRKPDGTLHPTEGRPLFDNMLNGYFDLHTNHAFFLEDSPRAQEVFSTIK